MRRLAWLALLGLASCSPKAGPPKLVDDGKFTSAESTTLARLGLANYFAAATVLPYAQFHEIAEHGKEMPGVDSIAARLRGRFFFHLRLSGS